MGKKNVSHVDSATELAKVYAAAVNPIIPPKDIPLRFASDVDNFNAVIAEAANVEWTDHKVRIAAILARTMSDYAYEQDMIRKEGSILTNENTGKRYANPRQQLVSSHNASINIMRRTLALHARAQSGESRDAAKQRQIRLDAQKKALGEGHIVDLIPR